MSDVERDLLAGLEDFTRRLESGVPVEATEVRCEETPDGPLHTGRKVLRSVCCMVGSCGRCRTEGCECPCHDDWK